jgi:predicted metalloprotease with PDZ domain
MPSRSLLVLVLPISALASGCAELPAAAAPPPAPGPIVLTVDATDAPRALIHAHLTIPARPGEMTLAYPKWIPGTHGPTGQLANLVDFRVSAGGRPIPWRRDSEYLYEVKVTVPAGTSAIDVDLDAFSPPAAVPDGALATQHVLALEWNRVVVYPTGVHVSALTVDARVRLPKGWSYATALPTAAEHDGSVDFRPASLETLVDSPLIAGLYFKSFDVGVQRGAPHFVDVAAETPDGLAVPQETVDSWKRLVAEANALFGARHYESYHFLVTESDHLWIGLEHHASSEEGLKERGLVDADQRRANGDYMAHEYAHSWDGKYRRPRGLATPDYQEPMRGDLLWVYEGLTQYLGWVLASRSRTWSLDDARAVLADAIVDLDQPGRKWRPLIDTAVAAQILWGLSGSAGASIRREVDYYYEGQLIWLEADVLIRQKTGGARSLDDFCQRFFGKADGPPEVRPYDLEEVIRTLDGVAANDWKGFFDARIYRIAPQVPLGGVEGAGYKVVSSDKKPEFLAAEEKAFKFTTYGESLGFSLNEDNVVRDVLAGSPASKAGLVAGMKIVAVDGHKYSSDVMKDALARARTSSAPIALLTEVNEFYATYAVDWHEGERYRVLERDPSKPDLLEAILAPKVTTSPAK